MTGEDPRNEFDLVESKPAPEMPAWLISVGLLLATLVAFIYWANLPYRPRAQGQLTACKSNLKNLATALEMYASDNQGLYPDLLSKVVDGRYLKTLPTCPSAQQMTYGNYHNFDKRSNFVMCCGGDNHARAYKAYSAPSRNFPAYRGDIGLIDHP